MPPTHDDAPKSPNIRRKELKKMAEPFLFFVIAVVGLGSLIQSILHRGGAVGASPEEPAGLSGPLPILLILLTSVAIFVAVARLGRARRRLARVALAASVLFAAHTAYRGIALEGEYWGTFPSSLAAPEAFMMYASEGLAFIGAGGLLAALAARRFGLKGFLPVLVVSPLVAMYVNAFLAEAFVWPWVRVTAQDALIMWAEETAVLYVLIWWIGREPKASAAAAQAATLPSTEASPLVGAVGPGSRVEDRV